VSKAYNLQEVRFKVPNAICHKSLLFVNDIITFSTKYKPCPVLYSINTEYPFLLKATRRTLTFCHKLLLSDNPFIV